MIADGVTMPPGEPCAMCPMRSSSTAGEREQEIHAKYIDRRKRTSYIEPVNVIFFNLFRPVESYIEFIPC